MSKTGDYIIGLIESGQWHIDTRYDDFTTTPQEKTMTTIQHIKKSLRQNIKKDGRIETFRAITNSWSEQPVQLGSDQLFGHLWLVIEDKILITIESGYGCHNYQLEINIDTNNIFLFDGNYVNFFTPTFDKAIDHIATDEYDLLIDLARFIIDKYDDDPRIISNYIPKEFLFEWEVPDYCLPKNHICCPDPVAHWDLDKRFFFIKYRGEYYHISEFIRISKTTQRPGTTKKITWNGVIDGRRDIYISVDMDSETYIIGRVQ